LVDKNSASGDLGGGRAALARPVADPFRSRVDVNRNTPILCGVLSFVALSVIVVPRHVRSIESDLAHRAESVLEKHGLAARIEVSGRDVSLSGPVSSDELRTQATGVVRDLWGVRSVENRMEASGADRLAASRPSPAEGSLDPPSRAQPAPPTLRVHAELRADGTIKLSGQAPSAHAVEAWLARSLSLDRGGALLDRLEVVETEDPERVESIVLEGLSLLNELEEGRLSASESRIRISGKASGPGVEEKIERRLSERLPPGYRASVDVYAPPMETNEDS
jgi:hypothetical protein